MASNAMTERFVVGIVRGPHGITGEFKVESASGEYEHFAKMKEVTLSDGTTEKLFRVEFVKQAVATLYMKLAGIDSPEDAAKYNRWEIIVPRENAHKLQNDEWYIEDLKGCSVWYQETANKIAPAIDEKSIVGKVTNVMEGGSGYLVEILLSEACSFLDDKIKFNKNGGTNKVLVPFKDEFIGTIDVKQKTMQLMHLWILE